MLNVAHHLSSYCFIISAPPLLSAKTLPCFSRDKACSLCSQSWQFTKGFKNNARGWSIHLILIKYFQLVLNKMNQHLEELFTPNLSNLEGRLSWFTRQFFESSKIPKIWIIISSKRRKYIPPCWISTFTQKISFATRNFGVKFFWVHIQSFNFWNYGF